MDGSTKDAIRLHIPMAEMPALKSGSRSDGGNFGLRGESWGYYSGVQSMYLQIETQMFRVNFHFRSFTYENNVYTDVVFVCIYIIVSIRIRDIRNYDLIL